ncbi:hypothetical protein NtRootA9_29090 [Arthrobacter sp. NtRootA9]|nr:hypothetical protein NtRootA9_29090 [Arthrobacter sp. NtRootA9]
MPLLGPNFSAVRELAFAADEVALNSARPLVSVAGSLDWNQLGPRQSRLDLTPLATASPAIQSAASTLKLTHARLQAIDTSTLVDRVAKPLGDATTQLGELNQTLSTVADSAVLLPSMLGASEARNYLILVQNSAEVRATGGLPGALALVRVDNGAIELVAQSTGSAIAASDPPIEIDDEQRSIYSTRLGKFIGDVNLTPDFPTAARTAKTMWESRYGGSIDGVVAVDPIVLAHLLEASGPLPLSSSALHPGLPTELTSENVVPTLLSDVYHAFETNVEQDEYFGAASQQVFQALASGKVSGQELVASLGRSYEEGRLHLWSMRSSEQEILEDIPLGGATSGPSAGGASFGVYFNDGTGAKMDYYMRRTVQLTQLCRRDDEFIDYRVKITSKNEAPAGAREVLTTAVTGGGKFGTPPGFVQTNVIVYGPAQALVDRVLQDGTPISFGSHVHSGRPVGVATTLLGPGETRVIEMSFTRVVQDDKPSLDVTPTIESVKEVALPVEFESCDSDQ